MSKTLSWGILGTGIIARIFARGLAASATGKLVAIGSRTQAAAEAFGEQQNVAKRYGSYDSLLADGDVQVVYIATPHPLHAEWAIKAAEAGKHVLCEKPIALNYPQALAIVEAAQRNDVFLMEAFMYRSHPQIAKLIELIRSGTIGEIRVIQANFSFNTQFNPQGRLFNNALGGGGILDVGCYCTSLARLVAGAANGKDFVEPVSVTGAAHIGEISRVDEYAAAILTFPGNIIAQLFAGVQVNGENVVRIFGSQGSILIPEPWVPKSADGTTRLIVYKNGEMQEIIVQVDQVDLYAREADVVAAHLEERQAPAPAMSWEDTLGNMRTLDRWREAVGLVYDAEKGESQTVPASMPERD